MKKRIAIQGYEGSFHQMAALQFYGKNVDIISCDSFKEVVKTASDSAKSDGAVMAIENSIAGSILPNYSLLQKSELQIVGEVYLQIKHNLLVNPGVRLEDIREVHTHYMALLQCADFLDKYNWKLVETTDTGSSAKNVRQRNSKHIAAIASKLAADLFQLKVLVPNIHTLKHNYTRFLVLQYQKEIVRVEDANKASVIFQADHTKGSLAKVLTRIAEGGINLSKLQSVPIPSSHWKYAFHADMEFDSVEQFNSVLKKMKPVTEAIKVYGVYKRGL